jgi:hypothetical protein
LRTSDAACDLAPALSRPGYPGMFSLADPARISEVLARAGFTRVTPTGVERQARWGGDPEDAAAFYLGSGPARARLADADPYDGPDGVQLTLAAWMVTAER